MPTTGSDPARVVAITMVRNEGVLLPRWLDYYGAQFGPENLLVIDDASTDGSTDDLPGSVVRLPDYTVGTERRGTGHGFAFRRAQFVSRLAQAMLRYYDTVVYVDVDEFLVPNPERFADLRSYVAQLEDDVVAAVGLNVLHVPGAEPPLDPDRPILAQRRHVKFTEKMCKPAITHSPISWTPGFHGCSVPYRVDPDLLLLHLKFFDRDFVLANQRARNALFETGRGGRFSTWGIPVDDLVADMDRWAGSSDDAEVLDTGRLPLAGLVVPEGDGFVSGTIGQRKSMATMPLLRLPDALREPF